MIKTKEQFFVTLDEIEKLTTNEFRNQIEKDVGYTKRELFFGLKSVDIHEDENYVIVVIAYEYLGVSIHKHYKNLNSNSIKELTYSDLELINKTVEGAKQ